MCSSNDTTFVHFYLISLCLNSNEPAVDLAYYSTVTDADPCLLNPNGIYGFGNSHMSTPFQKVQDGRNRFETLVRTLPTTATQDKLTEGILEILKCRDRYEFCVLNGVT